MDKLKPCPFAAEKQKNDTQFGEFTARNAMSVCCFIRNTTMEKSQRQGIRRFQHGIGE